MTQTYSPESGSLPTQPTTTRKNDALTAIAWGAGLLWGGLMWLASVTGVLAPLNLPVSASALFFLGFGLIFAVAIAITLLVPGYQHADFAAYIVCVGSIGLGLSGPAVVWPAVIIVLAVVLIAMAVERFRASAQ
jgi:hypothetical protein